MKIIKRLTLREGGSCAICDDDYTSLSGARVLAEYYEENGTHKYRITEPFNLCKKCYERENSN